jgi:ATP-binding cassette subfamily B protein
MTGAANAEKAALSHLPAALGLVWRPARWCVTAYVLVTAAGVAAPVAAAWLTKSILDRVTRPPVAASAVLGLALGLAVTAAGTAVLPQLNRYLQARLSRRSGLLVQDRLYAAVGRQQGLRNFEDPRFLDRLRMAQQAENAPALVFDSVLGLLGAVAIVVGFVVSLAALSPAMTLLLLGSAVPALIAQLWLARRQAAAYWEISPRHRREMFYATLLTDVQAAKEIRLFSAGDFLRSRMRAERLAAHSVEDRLDRRTLVVHGGLALTAAIVAGAGLLWAVSAAADGRLSAGDVTMFIASVAGVQSALGRGISDAARVQQSLLLFAHHAAVRGHPPDLPRAVPARAVPPLGCGIELRDVWFRYGPEHPWALRGVNLTIPYGRSVALVGRNGSGKSTLVKLLCRFYDPTRGAVLWDGVDIREFTVEDLRARLSVVFQDYMNYDLSAEENIALADVAGEQETRRVQEAADRAGIHHVLSRLPHGYSTQLTRIFTGESGPDAGVVLSGGQWQRVALARALVKGGPDLLILDEPSSGLDPEAEQQIHTQLARHRQGRTSLLISHRLSAVRDADRIVVLDDGAVAETGHHDSLLAAGGVYSGLFTLQAQGYREALAGEDVHRGMVRR